MTETTVFVYDDFGRWWRLHRSALLPILERIAQDKPPAFAKSEGIVVCQPIKGMSAYKPYHWSRDEMAEAQAQLRAGQLPTRVWVE